MVMDNLNTHNIASLYATFEPKHARELAERLEIHYTPKHYNGPLVKTTHEKIIVNMLSAK